MHDLKGNRISCSWDNKQANKKTFKMTNAAGEGWFQPAHMLRLIKIFGGIMRNMKISDRGLSQHTEWMALIRLQIPYGRSQVSVSTLVIYHLLFYAASACRSLDKQMGFPVALWHPRQNFIAKHVRHLSHVRWSPIKTVLASLHGWNIVDRDVRRQQPTNLYFAINQKEPWINWVS